jgi:predicted transcriptional regulator
LLSPREQQVAALVCLNYTTSQIASRLGITRETVRTHLRNLLSKFHEESKTKLRHRFTSGSDWDFVAWESSGLDPKDVHLLFTKLKSIASSKEGNIFTS